MKITAATEKILTLSNGWNIPLGYIFAIGLMIFCSALTIWYFKYKKWL